MFQKLVSHNEDIEKLVTKGYSVSFVGAYMVIRDIPYLGPKQELAWGTIVCKLVFTDKTKVRIDNHQVWFAGGSPHGLNGKPIPRLGDSPTTLFVGKDANDVSVERRFSNKPKTGFSDNYEKVESYVDIISGPATVLHGVTPYKFRVVGVANPNPVFKYQDTLTSRAGLGDMQQAFAGDIVAVIGLGGTGSYVLDFLSRTPVKEIRLYDGDEFHVHNAFRCPGQLIDVELGKPKAEVFANRFDSFRHGVSYVPENLHAENSHQLEGATFAFVCVDSGSARQQIHELLRSRAIPFIDVGMGLRRKEGSLRGMVRTTFYGHVVDATVVDKHCQVPLSDALDDEYKENIQIVELNALNAALAVIRYKQFRGFYAEDCDNIGLLYTFSDHHAGPVLNPDDAV